MIVENGTSLPAGAATPDVLVVGAGAVGIVLSLALARTGRRVTLLEAGPRDPEPNFKLRNQGPVTGRPYKWTFGRPTDFADPDGETRLCQAQAREHQGKH